MNDNDNFDEETVKKIVMDIVNRNENLIRASFFKLIGKCCYPYVSQSPNSENLKLLDDISQQIAEAIQKYIKSGKKIESIPGLVRTIVRNKVSDENRRLKRLIRVDKDDNEINTEQNQILFGKVASHENSVVIRNAIRRVVKELRPIEQDLF